MNAQRWKLAEQQHNKPGYWRCKFNKPCEVEIIKLVLRSTISQLHREIRSQKNKRIDFLLLGKI
jgi:hypothetical protein